MARVRTSPSPKRRPGRPPKKIPPISPHRIRPTRTSPPPPKSKGKRARAKPSSENNPFFKAKRILDETKTNYLIEWDSTNPKTKKPYAPSWHLKACANRALVAEWEAEKAGDDWEAQGIVAESEHYYKISWASNPKTGEVYDDTWEPKAFASGAIIKDWEQRKAEVGSRSKKSTAGSTTSNE